MSFELLIPLGLLGLLGIVVLIIIYIIKPNYQTRHISTTFIWKLSLRYQKKRPPTSKLRNILLFLCQVLILTAMAGIMAWPALAEHANADGTDIVVILDSSASMYAVNDDGETRFSRALDKLRDRSMSVIDNGGRVSVIVATDEPYFLSRRVDSTQKMRLSDMIGELAQEGASYAVSDIDKAMELGREIINENAATELYLITDTPYEKTPERVNIDLVRDEEEWNAAILDVTAVREEGYYMITAQVVSYGVSTNIEVGITVEGANKSSDSKPLEFVKEISCDADSVKTVVFRADTENEIEDDENIFYRKLDANERFTSFDSIRVALNDVDDSYDIDDVFYIYGGKKETVRVQYYSSDPNPFVNASLDIVRNAFSGRYDLEINEVKKGGEPELEGYDFYVFEHAMPEELPTDGVILMFDPDPTFGDIPEEAGFTVTDHGRFDDLYPLGEGADYQGHPIVQNIFTGSVEEGGLAVTRYDVITDYDDNYKVLFSIDGNPALMVQDNGATKIVVISFSVHYSNLPGLPEAVLLMYNIFDYFFPAVVSGNVFDVKEQFTVDTWGSELTFLKSSSESETFKAEELPMNFSIAQPGRYTFDMTTYYNRNLSVNVYVKPPSEESNIRATGIGITDPYDGADIETIYRDLLIILASILVALLFVEWIMHARENK